MLGLLATGASLIAVTAGCASAAGPGSAAVAAVSPAAVSPAAASPAAYASLQGAFTAAINEVLPSVVEIRTRAGLGSGVVFDSSGDIVTNAHVVGSCSPSGRRRLPARPEEQHDELVLDERATGSPVLRRWTGIPLWLVLRHPDQAAEPPEIRPGARADAAGQPHVPAAEAVADAGSSEARQVSESESLAGTRQ
jgi:hypothetical protein